MKKILLSFALAFLVLGIFLGFSIHFDQFGTNSIHIITSSNLKQKPFLEFSQPIITITAMSGSNMPNVGTIEFLSIDSLGNVQIYQDSLEIDKLDSSFINLNVTEMQAIYDTVIAATFFTLDSLYDSEALDGSGVYLSITSHNAQNTVYARNSCISEINRIVRTINFYIALSGIQLNYNEINEDCQ